MVEHTAIRIAEALESIAESLKQQASFIDPASMAAMLAEGGLDPEEAYEAVNPFTKPEFDEEGYLLTTQEEWDLPAPGYRISFSSNHNSRDGFDLWLIGPGGAVQPLQWQGR